MAFDSHPSGQRAELWYLTFERLEDHGGGLGTYIRQVMQAALVQGRAVRIFQPARAGQPPQRRAEGCVTVIDVPMIPTPADKALGWWMQMSWSMAEVVEAELDEAPAPLMIEVPDGFGLGYFLLQKKLTGAPALAAVPIVLCAHTPIAIIEEWIGNSLHTLPDWWVYRAERWCFRAADAVVTLSAMMEKQLARRGYLDPEVPLHRSVNPYLPGAAPFVPRPAGGAVVVGMASRMVDWKGLRQVLTVARAAEEAGLPATFELCGHITPDFERARRDFAALFDSGRVVYLGVLDAAQLGARRAGWTCQLHPSPADNFPYAVIESLARGLPCFITAGNGVADVLPEGLRRRLVVDYGRPEGVLEAIAEADEVRAALTALDLDLFAPGPYFEGRAALCAALRPRAPRRTFPFVDAEGARGGLRPAQPLPPAPSGARLTVVIPYFNMGPWIGPCIESLRASTVAVEIVLVNDGSRDPASIARLDDFRSDPALRVFDVANGGVARARNFGVDQARTEYVALLDADDTVEPDYYEKALAVLDRFDNVGFVGCWANDFRDGTGETIRHWVTYNAEPMPNIVMNNTNCQSLVYRTALYRAHGRHDPALKMYLDDWDGMLGMLEAGCYGVMLPEPLFNYRQRAGSIFSTGRGAWEANYAFIVQKRRALFNRNAAEVALFLNANGPNREYHILGQPSPRNFMAAARGGRLKMPHRLARSIAKRLMRFAEKGTIGA
jgi:glycosyltransferase involved in cell wall biosynthesis